MKSSNPGKIIYCGPSNKSVDVVAGIGDIHLTKNIVLIVYTTSFGIAHNHIYLRRTALMRNTNGACARF